MKKVRVPHNKTRGMHVPGKARSTIPKEHETILDDFEFNLKKLKQICIGLNIYQRSPEDCPFGRGNWVIDLMDRHNMRGLSIKLPLKMTKAQVDAYCKPLLDIYCYGVVETSDGERGIIQ